MHQMNFQSATQHSRESLHQWADRILTLATYAFPGVPDVHVYAIPRLCFGAENQDAGLHAFDGQPKTVEEAVDRMLYYQFTQRNRPAHSVRKMSPCAEHHHEESPMAEELVRIRSKVEKMEQTLGKSKYNPKRTRTRGRVGHARLQLGRCYQCGEVGHLQKDCQTRSKNGIAGGNQGKWRKHACTEASSNGIDSVGRRAAAYDNSQPSLVSCQQEVSMSPRSHEWKRNRKQRARLHHHFTLHVDLVDADRQPSSLDGQPGTLDGLEEEGERTRPCGPVRNSQRTAGFAVM